MNDPDAGGISGTLRLYAAGLAASLLCLSGCNGMQVFGQSVVPGDDIALAIEWQPDVCLAIRPKSSFRILPVP